MGAVHRGGRADPENDLSRNETSIAYRRIWWWIAVSPKATNSVAGGNATGFGHHLFSDPVRVEFTAIFDPFRVGSSFAQDPVALPPAIEFVAFGDRSQCESPNSISPCF